MIARAKQYGYDGIEIDGSGHTAILSIGRRRAAVNYVPSPREGIDILQWWPTTTSATPCLGPRSPDAFLRD
jgi:hypothetical protein